MPISLSILLGFLRFCILLLVLFIIYKMASKPTSSLNFMDFIINNWFQFGSVLLVLIFFEVELEIYSFVNMILVFLFISGMYVIGVKNLKNPVLYFKNNIKSNIKNTLLHLEKKKSFRFWDFLKQKNITSTETIVSIISAVFVGGITFFSRYNLFKFDLYSLSNAWLADLNKITSFDSQEWFSEDMNSVGSLAFANLYAKLSGVSPETALQSLGILESVLMGIMLFWMIQKITISKYVAPLIASLSFALIYVLSPFNIDFVNQFNPTFLAMTFAIPIFVFTFKPELITLHKKRFFLTFCISYISIGLIDLFAFFLLVPSFLLISLLFFITIRKPFFWLSLSAYLLSFAILIGIFALTCNYYNTDLVLFLRTNIVSLNSYTYLPQLILPVHQITLYYLFASSISVLLLLVYKFFYKENWNVALAFLLYFAFLIIIMYSNNPWIDSDLLLQSFIIFFPIIVGLSTAVIYRITLPIRIKSRVFQIVVSLLIVGLFIPSAYYFQNKSFLKFEENTSVQRQLIDVYDQINTQYFPLSYAVINEDFTQEISRHKHYFMSYSAFTSDYLNEDAVYFKNRNNKLFLKNNPHKVIPKALLLFIYNPKTVSVGYENLNDKLAQTLSVLQKRGRKIKLYYGNENFKILEIINEPESSKISDLIF